MMGGFDDSDGNSCNAQEVFMKRSMRSAFIRVDVCVYIKFSGLCGCVYQVRLATGGGLV